MKINQNIFRAYDIRGIASEDLSDEFVSSLGSSLSHKIKKLGLKHKIRVNAVAPGLTDTAQPRYGHSEEELKEKAETSPLGRMTKPDEIADMAVFLCSDRASMVTGQVYHVNGGTYLP